MSKWRSESSASAWAPNSPKATQRINIATVAASPVTPFSTRAVFFDGALSSPLSRRLARKKPLSLKCGVAGEGLSGNRRTAATIAGFYIDSCRRARIDTARLLQLPSKNSWTSPVPEAGRRLAVQRWRDR